MVARAGHGRRQDRLPHMFISVFVAITLAICGVAFGQSKFEIADVQVSPKATNQFIRVVPVRKGRYEIHTATMVDLIRTAYGFDSDKILGGPNWLEMDRFDVVAKAPNDTAPDALQEMLQALLAERFKLVVHKDTKPLPAYALTVGKKPQLKEADGSGDTGCRTQNQATGTPGDGSVRMTSMNAGGGTTTIQLGPGMTVQFACRNMTMEAFVAGLRGMMGVNATLGTNPILDKTGLKGAWNFDVKWSMQGLVGPALANGTERISVFDAIDKQLGLKLEQEQIPTPVMVVDSVDEKPSANPPGVAEALPPIPVPTAFEVADIRPTAPDFMGGMMRVQPGGRLMVQGMTLQNLLTNALNTTGGIFSSDGIAGVPKWAETSRWDITAKAPADAPALNMFTMGPMLRSLLEERFGLKTHTEERPVSAYTLVAAKPKMKKADPGSRTSCKYVNPIPPGTPPGSRVLTCQNITMAQFAEQLRNAGPGMSWPILDATGIEGGWDFTLTFGQAPMVMAGGGRGGEGGPASGDAPAASDPGGGFTIFEAVEKQLGLKLEAQKRPMQVVVVDHLEEKPTEN